MLIFCQYWFLSFYLVYFSANVAPTHTHTVTHTCIVCTESGKLWSFGSNKYGELGLSHGGPQATATPTLVECIKGNVVRVACGRLHSAAIDGGCVVDNYIC